VPRARRKPGRESRAAICPNETLEAIVFLSSLAALTHDASLPKLIYFDLACEIFRSSSSARSRKIAKHHR
jgi:hypothetical protein